MMRSAALLELRHAAATLASGNDERVSDISVEPSIGCSERSIATEDAKSLLTDL